MSCFIFMISKKSFLFFILMSFVACKSSYSLEYELSAKELKQKELSLVAYKGFQILVKEKDERKTLSDILKGYFLPSSMLSGELYKLPDDKRRAEFNITPAIHNGVAYKTTYQDLFLYQQAKMAGYKPTFKKNGELYSVESNKYNYYDCVAKKKKTTRKKADIHIAHVVPFSYILHWIKDETYAYIIYDQTPNLVAVGKNCDARDMAKFVNLGNLLSIVSMGYGQLSAQTATEATLATDRQTRDVLYKLMSFYGVLSAKLLTDISFL